MINKLKGYQLTRVIIKKSNTDNQYYADIYCKKKGEKLESCIDSFNIHNQLKDITTINLQINLGDINKLKNNQEDNKETIPLFKNVVKL